MADNPNLKRANSISVTKQPEVAPAAPTRRKDKKGFQSFSKAKEASQRKQLEESKLMRLYLPKQRLFNKRPVPPRVAPPKPPPRLKPLSLSFMQSLPLRVPKKTNPDCAPKPGIQVRHVRRPSFKRPDRDLVIPPDLDLTVFFANDSFVHRFSSLVHSEESVYDLFRAYFCFVQDHCFDGLTGLFVEPRLAELFKTALILERISLFICFSLDLSQ